MRLPPSVLLLAFGFLLPGAAGAEPNVVPVEQAPYHRPVFRNELVMLLSVYLPPGAPRGPEVFHTHSLDQISVLAQASEMTNKELGQSLMSPLRLGDRGHVNFNAFSKKPLTHTGANGGSTPFHNIVVALLYPQGGRFTPGSRASGYQQLIDNDRVRAWRLQLESGQSVAAVTQSAPGMRIVVDGGEISESVPGAPDRAWGLRNGEFFWQDPGVTRSVKNIGTTPINIVEFELK